MKNEIDSFSWIDDIIIQHKMKEHFCIKDFIPKENQIEYLLQENLELKKKNLALEGLLNEKNELKEIYELKQKQILLMEQKIISLEKIMDEYKYIQDKIDFIYNQLSYNINIESMNIEMNVEQKLNSIEKVINSLQLQNNKYKEICELIEENQNYNNNKLNNNKTEIKYNNDYLSPAPDFKKMRNINNEDKYKKIKLERERSAKSQRTKKKLKI